MSILLTVIETFNVILPYRNAKSILYGMVPIGTDNRIINTLILLYKQFVFNCKERPKTLIFTMYKLRVKQFEHIESVISKKMENISVNWKDGLSTILQ